MNRLQYETSPYLLQHAGNPVDWYPWGEEALAKARTEDKPIIVSIGYSTCHWCHVMERESFENDSVAAYMNENFVCIKVDREERPDVDQVYMEACQAISGSGGWPLNAFLLPDTRPFYAGTYFPPESKYNRPGWLDLLRHLNRLYHEDRDRVIGQAEQLTNSIGKAGELFIKPPEVEDPFAPIHLDAMVRKLKSRYDTVNGGFGGAPKFPMSQSLELLLDFGMLHQDEQAIQLAEHGVLSMIRGGIYDQLGGGFARYTVDGAWRVPHFEKMLYDNALLLRLLGKLQMTQPKSEYLSTIVETINWLEREMRSPSGSFYAALDADSEGVEGKFYTWTYDELKAVLDEEELTQVQSWLGSSQAGNWEEEKTNILYRPVEVRTEDQTHLAQLKNKLFTAREVRIR
ncbi:MAG: thioredoxin domain-containing protein, partial [Bacteroidota bacterium]